MHSQGVPHTQAESLSIAIRLRRHEPQTQKTRQNPRSRQAGSNSKADKKRSKKKKKKKKERDPKCKHSADLSSLQLAQQCLREMPTGYTPRNKTLSTILWKCVRTYIQHDPT